MGNYNCRRWEVIIVVDQSKRFPRVSVSELNVIGYGIAHAFGNIFESRLPKEFEVEFEKSCITGTSVLFDTPMNSFPRSKASERFTNHLLRLDEIRSKYPKKKWEDFIHAISVADVVEHLSRIMHDNNIDPTFLDRATLSELVQEMPSRRFDMHLHRLILAKSDYYPKDNDLEDWAGAGLAAMYCDYVVCEKHMADMLGRNSFKTKATVFRRIEDLDKVL